MMKTRTAFMGKCAAMLVVAVAIACTVFALPAYANRQLDAPTTVSDDITRVHVAKLDADTHEYAGDATMAIIDEESGEVVDSWVTEDGMIHEYEKGVLVVERVYILRELEAPEGFSKVDDVRFVINKDEGKGLTILSGTEGQYEQANLDQINLYDKAGSSEIVTTVTETRPAPSSPTKAAAPKTGDETPMSTVAILVVAGIIAVILLQIPKRRMGKE